jgi:hypothetical protein
MKEKILELRKKGLSYNEIKNILGCSKGTISFHCRKNNLSDPNKFRKPSDEEKEEMQRRYDVLGSYKKVAQECGWSKYTVLKYVKTKKSEKMSDEEYKKMKSNSVISWRQRTKVKLVEYKGRKCKICGYDGCIQAMEFHHLDPKEKDFTISGKSWSFERLKEESDKCVLVCNRCHTEIHAGLHENYKQ